MIIPLNNETFTDYPLVEEVLLNSEFSEPGKLLQNPDYLYRSRSLPDFS